MQRQNGHIWLPVARCIETSVNSVMVAQMEGWAEGLDVNDKMDEELPVEEWAARVVRTPGEPTPRSDPEKTNMESRAGGHSWTVGPHLHGNLLRDVVAGCCMVSKH